MQLEFGPEMAAQQFMNEVKVEATAIVCKKRSNCQSTAFKEVDLNNQGTIPENYYQLEEVSRVVHDLIVGAALKLSS